MISLGTMNKETWDVLKTLVRGRANVLISGGVGSGKTTLLRTMAAVIDPTARIIVLETDSELLLQNAFPERDIIEFE
jgi:pilus assembly protein CpaF